MTPMMCFMFYEHVLFNQSTVVVNMYMGKRLISINALQIKKNKHRIKLKVLPSSTNGIETFIDLICR